MEIFVIILLAFLFGLIPAVIADKKGHSFLAWWAFGTLLLIVALPVVFFVEDRSGKRCPECAEWVKRDAKKCRHCGASFYK